MEVTSAAEQKLDFLTLLVTELQNQNPLEPMEQKDMAAQLAQFSQLELTEEMNGNISSMNDTIAAMNSSFDGAMLRAKWDSARDLLGKDVLFYEPLSGQNYAGHVTKVSILDGEPILTVDTGQDDIGTVEVKQDQIEGVQI
jgi:flagellar hook assembly protein FlgD